MMNDDLDNTLLLIIFFTFKYNNVETNYIK